MKTILSIILLCLNATTMAGETNVNGKTLAVEFLPEVLG